MAFASTTVSTAASPHIITLNSNHENDPILQWCGNAPGASSSQQWQRPYLVALLADPQVGWNLKQFNSEDLLRQAATHLERLQPDLILVAGDLIQASAILQGGGGGKNKELYELKVVKQILDQLNIPYFVTSGNHDLLHRPSDLAILDGFVDYWHTPHYWYGIEFNSNTLFLMLETNLLLQYQENPNANPQQTRNPAIQQLAQEQFDWIETMIASGASKYDRIIPIGHHPMALQHMNEEDSGLNTPLPIRKKLGQLYNSSPKISHVFAGHIHNIAKVVDEESNIQYITYPATGVVLDNNNNNKRKQPSSGFALLTLNTNNDGGDSSSLPLLEEQYYGYHELPATRPDLSDASLQLTYPNGYYDLVENSEICITWTSTHSMTNRVKLLYSIDIGKTWIEIGDGPNVGIYPWKIPTLSLESDSPPAAGIEVYIAVASAYNLTIVGTSQGPNHIVVASDSNNNNTSSNREYPSLQQQEGSSSTTSSTNNNEEEDGTLAAEVGRAAPADDGTMMTSTEKIFLGEELGFGGGSLSFAARLEKAASSSASASSSWSWSPLLLMTATTITIVVISIVPIWS